MVIDIVDGTLADGAAAIVASADTKLFYLAGIIGIGIFLYLYKWLFIKWAGILSGAVALLFFGSGALLYYGGNAMLSTYLTVHEPLVERGIEAYARATGNPRVSVNANMSAGEQMDIVYACLSQAGAHPEKINAILEASEYVLALGYNGQETKESLALQYGKGGANNN